MNLKLVNSEIKEWFEEEAKATILLVNAREVEENETLNLYQHDLHKKKIKRAAISSLTTPEGLIYGHKKCADFITKEVSDLLENEFEYDTRSQISLLNADFKILTGIENKRFSTIISHIICPSQFALGKEKRIHHAIALARDTIFLSNSRQKGAAIADLDFKSAFDLLCMDWVYKVMEKKGLSQIVIARIKRYYGDSYTIPIINSIPGKRIKNQRVTLRQGDCPSSLWFGIAIDPLLAYMNRRLSGITLISKPTYGPLYVNAKNRLDPIEEKLKLIGYCDDVKPTISKRSEFELIEKAVSLFERASGCQLHRDPTSKKCKILLLGTWRNWTKNQIPLKYLTISDHLGILGVKLFGNFIEMRAKNG